MHHNEFRIADISSFQDKLQLTEDCHKTIELETVTQADNKQDIFLYRYIVRNRNAEIYCIGQSTMEYVGGVHQHLLTIHSMENHSRVRKLARRVLQCFRVFDIGYFVTGLALTVSAADYDLSSHTENVLFGGSLLLFSGLSP